MLTIVPRYIYHLFFSAVPFLLLHIAVNHYTSMHARTQEKAWNRVNNSELHTFLVAYIQQPANMSYSRHNNTRLCVAFDKAARLSSLLDIMMTLEDTFHSLSTHNWPTKYRWRHHEMVHVVGSWAADKAISIKYLTAVMQVFGTVGMSPFYEYGAPMHAAVWHSLVQLYGQGYTIRELWEFTHKYLCRFKHGLVQANCWHSTGHAMLEIALTNHSEYVYSACGPAIGNFLLESDFSHAATLCAAAGDDDIAALCVGGATDAYWSFMFRPIDSHVNATRLCFGLHMGTSALRSCLLMSARFGRVEQPQICNSFQGSLAVNCVASYAYTYGGWRTGPETVSLITASVHTPFVKELAHVFDTSLSSFCSMFVEVDETHSVLLACMSNAWNGFTSSPTPQKNEASRQQLLSEIQLEAKRFGLSRDDAE